MSYFRIISSPDTPQEERRIKPFTLVKYFTLSSLILTFIGALVLSTLHTHLVRNLLLKKSEDYAQLLVENLNHQIFLQFLLPVYFQYGRIQLRDKEQFQRMDTVVRNTIHSFNVDMVNIYDLDNVISYSFNSEIIGEKDIGGAGYKKALNGKSVTRLVQIGSFWEMLFRLPQVTRITTFAPLRMEKPMSTLTGPVIGVVEIVQNVSSDYRKVFRLQVLVILTSTLVMGTLFLFLRMVVQRGEAIIDERTRERFRLKEELDRSRHLSSIGEMTAAISHEIRNPLGIIRSSAELVRKRIPEGDSMAPITDVIIEESGRMNDIITDFLNYARPRIPELAPCLVSDILEKNIAFLGPELERTGMTISLEGGSDIPRIEADSVMLYQAFLNLLMNALQAMEAGGHIRISVQSTGGGVGIRIEDTGTGIPEETLAKIRDPFFTTKDKGTGLGLGIVEKMIEAHAGSLEIENRAEGGVRVTVRIPAIPDEEALESHEDRTDR